MVRTVDREEIMRKRESCSSKEKSAIENLILDVCARKFMYVCVGEYTSATLRNSDSFVIL